ncbi:Uncharacterised protein [uncultured archaeon]|nr:Uncharacterised protein [uncultured archaeon]
MLITTGKTRVFVDRDIHLDCDGEFAFVSHAHSDHVKLKKAKHLIASPETKSLINAKGVKLPEDYSNDKIELLEAGHVLGARQLRASTDTGVFTYTGDFCLEKNILGGGAETKECDSLLMETTFGLPKYEFPERSSIYDSVIDFQKNANGITVYAAYSLGKTQELIKLLNDKVGLIPLVGKEAAEISRVYNKYGCNLKFIELGTTDAEEVLDYDFVAILPPRKFTPEFIKNLRLVHGKKVSSAFVSGWAVNKWYSWCDAVFPLSNHSDYSGLVEYVERVSPKKVFCTHGFSKEFAADLARRGFQAQSI